MKNILNLTKHEECLHLNYWSLNNHNSMWIKISTSFIWYLFLMCGATKISEILLSSIEKILKSDCQPNFLRINTNQFNMIYDLTIRAIGYNFFEIVYPMVHLLVHGFASDDSEYVTLILVISLSNFSNSSFLENLTLK